MRMRIRPILANQPKNDCETVATPHSHPATPSATDKHTPPTHLVEGKRDNRLQTTDNKQKASDKHQLVEWKKVLECSEVLWGLCGRSGFVTGGTKTISTVALPLPLLDGLPYQLTAAGMV